ncbi:MAG: exodeoxyribonuclease VII small subunit [Candidatus Magasanikbacteria bacterium]|nr:exodeoxyribonuclease VII small subunit [Candidatus Magasanikbacteria bacterium]
MSPKNIAKINFSKSYNDLQRIMEWFEKGEVDLEEGVKKFEEGLKLVGELKKYLQGVENKVKQIKMKFEKEEGAENVKEGEDAEEAEDKKDDKARLF